MQYKATSLEKQHKHELLTEPDLGVTIDLINPDTYRIDPNSKSSVNTHHIDTSSKCTLNTHHMGTNSECTFNTHHIDINNVFTLNTHHIDTSSECTLHIIFKCIFNKLHLHTCFSVLLDPADEKLLEEEIQAPTSSKRSEVSHEYLRPQI